MKYKVVLQAQVFANTKINENIEQTVELCNRFDVPIGFDFNGIYIIAFPDSKPQILLRDYEDQLKKRESKVQVQSDITKEKN